MGAVSSTYGSKFFKLLGKYQLPSLWLLEPPFPVSEVMSSVLRPRPWLRRRTISINARGIQLHPPCIRAEHSVRINLFDLKCLLLLHSGAKGPYDIPPAIAR